MQKKQCPTSTITLPLSTVINSPVQFEIWQVRLDPTQGSEQAGKRPCVILQTNVVNHLGNTILIAPVTSQKLDRSYSHHIVLAPSEKNGLSVLSKMKCDQVRVIDKTRLVKKMGIIEKIYYEKIFNALEIIFDFRGDFREG